MGDRQYHRITGGGCELLHTMHRPPSECSLEWRAKYLRIIVQIYDNGIYVLDVLTNNRSYRIYC